MYNGRIKKEGGIWSVNGFRFKELRPGIIEVFLMNHWPLNEIDIRGREVVDIGSYIGDTPLYFLKQGARRVIAIEPHPIAFREMLENIELNGVRDKIMPINAAIGSSKGSTYVPVNMPLSEVWVLDALESSRDEDRAQVSVITLEDIMSYVEDPYLIKIDCQGCEYEILKVVSIP